MQGEDGDSQPMCGQDSWRVTAAQPSSPPARAQQDPWCLYFWKGNEWRVLRSVLCLEPPACLLVGCPCTFTAPGGPVDPTHVLLLRTWQSHGKPRWRQRATAPAHRFPTDESLFTIPNTDGVHVCTHTQDMANSQQVPQGARPSPPETLSECVTER